MDLTEQELRNKEAFSRKEALEQYSRFYLFPVEERILSAHFGIPGRVLDIGCGCGRTSLFLKRMGHSITGIDLVPEMIEEARKLVEGVDFIVMDACDLLFPNESFDYVLFSFNGIDCIYPSAKRNSCLKEIHRVLRGSGVFAFSAHNLLSLKIFFPTNRFRLGNLLLNLKNRRILSQYRLERHPSGLLDLYFTSVGQQKQQLLDIGYTGISVYGQQSDYPLFTRLYDTWSYYVCRKARP
jgi:ubiquinone/menaquinone biosynthesis C-methylase UbiE